MNSPHLVAGTAEARGLAMAELLNELPLPKCPECGRRPVVGDVMVVLRDGSPLRLSCARHLKCPPSTIRVIDGPTCDGGYYDAPGCAEQSESGNITTGGHFHYVGNSTVIPGFSQWCVDPRGA